MNQPLSTITLGQDQQDGPASPHPGRRPIKFAYASGAQPLSGYTIKRGIGIGGFGEVYYATSDAGKEVALKRIQRNLDVELRGVRQCLNLKHPNLLALYDIRYDDEGQAWVVMEYVAGQNLQEVIERHPHGMPLNEVNHWLKGIAAGVHYLHDHGIVHRDLKPANIFVDQGVVKIGDYGLSKFISCSRRSGQTESVGTFHYMAPEIGLGRYGKEIDIYALGIVLYEMLTGHVPFDGETSQEIIMKHLTAEPDVKHLPSPYREVAARALAKAPEDRYATVEEMIVAVGLAEGAAPASQLPGHGGVAAPVHAAQRNRSEHMMAKIVKPAATAAWQASTEEPIARGLRHAWYRLREAWQRANLNTFTRLLLLTIAIVLLIVNVGWIVPSIVIVALLYSAYFLVWYVLTTSTVGPKTPPSADPRCLADQVGRDSPATPVTPPQPPPSPAPKKRATRQQLEDALRQWLRGKPRSLRLAELTGSMLMAAVVSAVMTVVMLVVGSEGLDTNVSGWLPLYLWMSLTSLAGAWCVLALGKMWEGAHGDQALRRFHMLATGLFVGGFAYLLAEFLAFQPTYVLHSWRGVSVRLTPALYAVDGTPRILAYLGYFGALFLVLRWWRSADPLRVVRLGIWSTVVTIVFAVILDGLLPMPRGFMIAAITVVSVQLSAPWMHERQRKRLGHELGVLDERATYV